MIRFSTALFALTVCWSLPVPGQRLESRFNPSWTPQLAQPPARSAPGLFPDAPDYRWEGLTLGGVVVGTLGLSLARGFCGDSDTNTSGRSCVLPAIEGLLMGAVVGGVTGGLIGSLIPKPPLDSPSSR